MNFTVSVESRARLRTQRSAAEFARREDDVYSRKILVKFHRNVYLYNNNTKYLHWHSLGDSEGNLNGLRQEQQSRTIPRARCSMIKEFLSVHLLRYLAALLRG